MMFTSRIRTPRLELIPASPEILSADRDNRLMLARLLTATVPPGWPPPLLDQDTLDEFIRIQSGGSDPFFCCWYWVRHSPEPEGRVLIGCGGIAAKPGEQDSVVLGYSVLSPFQNKGYATEAVQHLIPAIFSVPGIRYIFATTYPELAGSIRVLEKNGFAGLGKTAGGSGFEEGTALYVRMRTDRRPVEPYMGPDVPGT